MNAGKRRKFGSFGNPGHLDKRQRKHLQQFGELHPAEERETGREFYRKVKDEDLPLRETENICSEDTSDEENEEEASDYQQLVSTLGAEPSSSSSSEEEFDTEEEDDDDDDGNEENQSENDDDEGEIEVQDDSDIDEVEDVDTNSGDESENEETDSGHSEKEDDYRTDDISEEEAEEHNVFLKENDPFSIHFEKDIPDQVVDKLGEISAWKTQQLQVSHLGRCTITSPKDMEQNINTSIEKDIKKLHVKHKLLAQTSATNKKYAAVTTKGSDLLSTLQINLFNIINRYQDLYYPDRNKANSEEIRLVYCLHALNHALKTRSRVTAHNSKIKSKREEIPDEYRDQGLTRPKVLMVLPFRESALRVVQILSMLLMSEDEGNVEFKKRFYQEYSEEEKSDPPENKPEDFVETFAGNIDDHFRIGIGVTKKSLKLYANFYSSDIILASPLGLRTIIGAEGEEERDHDFLSSIEVLIFDQTDIFLMQNWDHINHLMTHMHLQPKEPHGVDFSRVRMWTLNGWSKFYRQTLIFSSTAVPEINALFNKHCHNYAGKFQVARLYNRGAICQIHIQLPQVFHRIGVGNFTQVAEARFEYFKSKVLPQYKDDIMSGTMIFIPSYYDFVRLRNFFKAQELDFVHISEYSTEKQISKARNGFNKRGKHFMLFTERFHFYKRLKIRGIKHIVFYDLPYYSHLYSEICNFIPDPQRSSKAVNWDITALYTKYDAQKLAAMVGNERAAQMIHAQKNVHMFVTGYT